MKKLRFKNRNGVLYFGIDGNFKSSKMKYNVVNKNILIGKHNRGELNDALGFDDGGAGKNPGGSHSAPGGSSAPRAAPSRLPR